ncbi:MAG TPA: hypothetical protein VJH37_02840 [Candidatus Nanoarchaeia archaeon]|nr:hypothetical protein [Candidatus Nanoarchaeia archaeon]
MSYRRIKRKVKEHKTKILVVVGLIVVIALVVLLMSSVNSPVKELYDLTEMDVLSINGVTGNQISLKGIALGDTQQQVLDVIGYPDQQNIYMPDITNMEFGKAFNINETAVVLQFKADSLEKITVFPAFNEFLVGKTKVNYTKDEFLITHGKPESVKQIPMSEGSAIVIRLYKYKEGIEFTTRRGIQLSLSFVRENSMSTEL